MLGATAFFAYLGQTFTGPNEPKFTLDKELVDIAKQYQPGLVAEHYYKENSK